MEEFEFYSIKTTNKKVVKSFSKLENLYKQIPETKGCLENLEDCKGWCCNLQTPQLLYVEFLNIWKEVLNDKDLVLESIERSLINYVQGFTTKGCVFFNQKTKLCNCHKKRPYNCYIYGITPKEEFQPRYERMKEMYKDKIDAVIKDQCPLVSTINEEKVSVEDTDKWWQELVKIEKSIGIPENLINDDIGGSYRTPHDHLLLYIMPDSILQQLQCIRMSDNIEEKLLAVNGFMRGFKKNLND